jgi:seryl-tRNA synthetase
MLQIQTLREEKQRVVSGLEKKGLSAAAELVEKAIQADENRKDLQHQLNKLQEDANRQASEIGALMKSGKREEAENLKAGVARLKEEIKETEANLGQAETALFDALVILPNVPHESLFRRENRQKITKWPAPGVVRLICRPGRFHTGS